jgi:hypothetical protein
MGFGFGVCHSSQGQTTGRDVPSDRTWTPRGIACFQVPHTNLVQRNGTHKDDYDPFIKSDLASRNELSSLMWCKYGHVLFIFDATNRSKSSVW